MATCAVITPSILHSTAGLLRPAVVCRTSQDLPISIECVDNADGCPGGVIYDNQTFPISSDQDAAHETASGDGQGPASSVRVFHLDADEDYIVPLEDPPEISIYSDTSFHSCLEDEVDEDE